MAEWKGHGMPETKQDELTEAQWQTREDEEKPPASMPALRRAQEELVSLRTMAEILVGHSAQQRARMLMWLSSFFREPMPIDEGNDDA